MRKACYWGVAALIVLTLTACGQGGGTSAPPPDVGGPVDEGPDLPPPDVPPTSTADGPWALDLARGRTQFVEKCQGCHGESGRGGYGPALTDTGTCPPCAEFTRLWQRIDEFMPFRNPAACDAQCARDIAAWIFNGFSTEPSCTVDFLYDSMTGNRFTATVRIVNLGALDVPTWRLGLSLPAGHTLVPMQKAIASESNGQVLVSPEPDYQRIGSGATLAISFEGTHGGTAVVPGDLRLEAPPCFTAPPAAMF